MDLVEVITMAASQDRITGMAALLLPPLSLIAVFATATGGHGNGWLYEVLVKVGVPDDSATTISNILVRPLEIILIALITWMVARLGARVIRRLLTTAAKPATARSDSPRAELRVHSVVSLIANVWRVVVFFVGAFIILGILGVDLTPLLASATVIGATIGFGAQQLVRDYLSGFLLTCEDQFAVGDVIAVNDTSGTVEQLSLRVTRLRAADGTVFYVPNGDIRKLGNLSRGWAKAVVDLPARAADADELDRVKDVIGQSARDVAQRPVFAAACTEPPQVLGLIAADAGGCTVRVTLRTIPTQRDILQRALLEAAVERLVHEDLWPVGPPAAV